MQDFHKISKPPGHLHNQENLFENFFTKVYGSMLLSGVWVMGVKDMTSTWHYSSCVGRLKHTDPHLKLF